MTQKMMECVEKTAMKPQPPQFEIGDTVEVHCLIMEGEKTRTQIFSGTVIARSGSGSKEMFTVRRIVAGQGVERKFPVHSPRIDKVDVKRSGAVSRQVVLSPRASRQSGETEGTHLIYRGAAGRVP